MRKKSLLQAWSFRGAPAVFPHAGQRRVPVRPEGAGHTSSRGFIRAASPFALQRLGLTVQQLWPLVESAAEECLRGCAVTGKPALDAAVAALAAPHLPAEAQPVWNSPSPYGRPDVQTLGGAAVSFLLRPCAFERLVVFGRREGRAAHVHLAKGVAGQALSSARADAALQLVRRFLHCYGPATPAALQSWLGACPAQAKAHVGRRSAEMQPVKLAGRTAWMLAQDVPALPDAAPGQPQLLLLGPHDPYLDVHSPHEKALLLPDAALHKAVWQTISNPGVLLKEGSLQACGAKDAGQKPFAFSFTLFALLSPAERACAVALAQRYAAFRGQRLAACTLEN